MVLSNSVVAQQQGAENLFLQTLKKETAANHHKLESQSSLALLMTAEVNFDQYYKYLVRMLAIELEYENKVLPALSFLFPPIIQQRRSVLIREDINSIGYASTKTAVNGFHIQDEVLTPAFALGFMYVMEGSKLGGKVIHKHLHKVLGISTEKGAKFLTDDGSDTGKHWRDFLKVFGRFVTERQKEDEATAGANHAFELIYDYFESNERHDAN